MSVEIKISNFFGDDLRFVRHNNEWTDKQGKTRDEQTILRALVLRDLIHSLYLYNHNE